MLHSLSFIVVIGFLLPVLTSSFPQSSRWKEMYEEMQAAENAGQQIPEQDSRSLLLHKALDTLIRIQQTQEDERQQQQQQQQKASIASTSSRLLSPGVGGMMQSAPASRLVLGGGSGGEGYPPVKDLLARMLGLGLQVLPPSGSSGSSSGGRLLHHLHRHQPQQPQPLPLPLSMQLSQARKRGGFVGAPGSAGGPNMFGR